MRWGSRKCGADRLSLSPELRWRNAKKGNIKQTLKHHNYDHDCGGSKADFVPMCRHLLLCWSTIVVCDSRHQPQSCHTSIYLSTHPYIPTSIHIFTCTLLVLRLLLSLLGHYYYYCDNNNNNNPWLTGIAIPVSQPQQHHVTIQRYRTSAETVLSYRRLITHITVRLKEQDQPLLISIPDVTK